MENKKIKTLFFKTYYSLIDEKLKIVSEDKLMSAIKLLKTITKKNKIILIGNGGSAAIASHLSVDFTKVANIRSINFNEADLLTCFANDYGYEKAFQKAIEFYSEKGDIVIAISSSGKSKNIINAVKYAKKIKLKTITFTGFEKDNPLKKLGNINFWIDSKAYNIVEIVHQTLLLSIVDYLVGNIYYKSS